MTTTPWEKIDEIFAGAIELSPEEREGYLKRVAEKEPEAVAEVRSLLHHQAMVGEEFLQPPPDSIAKSNEVTDADDPFLGKTIGGFTISGVIGRGGMGTVYTAEQANPKRTVALKVMRAGLTSSYTLRHFEREARILSKLNHPNIAQVYSAGTFRNATTGNLPLPYFALEYVADAHTITEFAEANSLSADDRLRLFLDICGAVHHGHQRGVIHRDLKPGNLLVDAEGRVKVIDFGVARTTDSDIAATTMQTDVQQLVGTLPYMSPEQCGGDALELDTRSDVYSLGVVLYELVCGQLPYELPSTSIQAVTRAVCELLPTPPRVVSRTCGRDLEAVILKALEKNRDKRYQSAVELGADVSRHIHGEPVEARTPGFARRLQRFVGRHPIITTSAMCAFVATTTLAATWYSIWWTSQRPDRVELSTDQKVVRLLSSGGAVIDKIELPEAKGISFARLTRQDPQLGGQELVLVGFSHFAKSKYRGSICAFLASSGFEQLVWRSQLASSDMPSDVNEHHSPTRRAFGPQDEITIADIFPDSPGNEVAVVFSHLYSRRCLRIYDLTGEVLFQAWVDGAISKRLYWLPTPRLLLFTGDDSRLFWSHFGIPACGDYKPRLVVALRPQLGKISEDYINYDMPGSNEVLVWRRYLLPGKLMHWRPIPELQLPPAPFDPDSYFALRVESSETGLPSFFWVMDSEGQIVPRSLTLSDTYRVRMSELPDPTDFYLGPLPEKPSPDSRSQSGTRPEEAGQADSVAVE